MLIIKFNGKFKYLRYFIAKIEFYRGVARRDIGWIEVLLTAVGWLSGVWC